MHARTCKQMHKHDTHAHMHTRKACTHTHTLIRSCARMRAQRIPAHTREHAVPPHTRTPARSIIRCKKSNHAHFAKFMLAFFDQMAVLCTPLNFFETIRERTDVDQLMRRLRAIYTVAAHKMRFAQNRRALMKCKAKQRKQRNADATMKR